MTRNVQCACCIAYWMVAGWEALHFTPTTTTEQFLHALLIGSVTVALIGSVKCIVSDFTSPPPGEDTSILIDIREQYGDKWYMHPQTRAQGLCMALGGAMKILASLTDELSSANGYEIHRVWTIKTILHVLSLPPARMNSGLPLLEARLKYEHTESGLAWRLELHVVNETATDQFIRAMQRYDRNDRRWLVQD